MKAGAGNNHFDRLSEILSGRRAAELDNFRDLKQSAVAMILSDHGNGVCLLMIQRARHPRDPWSGHMGFPGGRMDPEDSSPEATAERETREELGFELKDHADRLGRLTQIQARARQGLMPLAITPIVYTLHTLPQMTKNHEVVDSFWIPLEFLLEQGNRSAIDNPDSAQPATTPCYHIEGKTVWGLSLLMIDELLEILR